MSQIVYFSKMFQAVPHLAQIAQILPGVFVSSRHSTLKATRKLYPQLQQSHYSKWLKSFSQGYKLLNTADVIVTGAPYKTFLTPFNAKKCMVFHGTYMLLSKKAFAANSHFDLLCTIGPRMQQMMGRFSDEIHVKSVATGFLPFCEFPEQSTLQRESFLLSLGLSPDKKTILFTPSRRGVGSWDFLAEFLAKKTSTEYNLILRPHPSQALTSRVKDRKSFRRVAILTKSRPHALLDLTSQPLSALLSVADLVISDANSPAEESLYYDVAQLFIETPVFSREVIAKMGRDEDMHKDDIEQLMTLYECGPSQFVKEENTNISSSIEKAIIYKNNFEHHRSSYFSWVFGNRDRSANTRVANAINEILFKEKSTC